MKAAITTKYGPPEVLKIREVDRPELRDDEILVRVRASTVTAGDCELRRFDMPLFLRLPMRLVMGIRRPRINILGQEFAGDIVSTGKNVSRFKPGDAVLGPTTMKLGAHAEYLRLKTNQPLVIKPPEITYAAAAAIPVGALNALHFLRKANIRPGEQVLVIGAGGSIGTVGVQLAKYREAEVTAVDSGDKLDVLRSIGADHVIDFTTDQYWESKQSYDVIFDVVGKSPFVKCMRLLSPGGRYVLANPGLSRWLRGMWATLTSSRRFMTGVAPYRQADLVDLVELYARGTLRSVIDRRFSLDLIVDAHRYVEAGRKTGNVIIEISSG